ncbi:MAG: hypothetical protein CVU73_09445 [Deltaproteobacteria bacterium HGW-Deltaproteobacteria-8]|nr:MAG: hypothetical protein CVU73_09445 [Deltaproteobacteria bacterium HGW-Deltaproteobacteria-8]
MISKATILIAVCLVLFGYRWGKRKAQMKSAPPPVQPAAGTAAESAPKKEWISVKALLVIVAVLLLIAILSSLGGKIG